MTAQPLKRIANFAAHLRANGYKVGVAEQQAMLQSVLLLDLGRRERIEAGWRSLVCGRADEWRRFPELFRDYWFPHRTRGRRRLRASPHADLRHAVADLQARLANTPAMAGQPPPTESLGLAGASRQEAAEQRPLEDWLPEQQQELERRVAELARQMRTRLTRRLRLDPQGHRLDLRRTLRHSLRTGGIPFEPAWLSRRKERPKLVILVDVSRSMQTHARLFLRVAMVFAAVLKARVFVFHTRLAELTSWLQHPSAAERIAAVSAGFSSGTRIAGSLRNLIKQHVDLDRHTRLMIMSDGHDGDPEGELAAALAAIRKRGARIDWLHPGRQAPQSTALAGCAGHIHAFAPLADLDSLARLDHLLH